MVIIIFAVGIAVVLVEQNARAALKLASRGYVLENGEVVAEGTGQALLAVEAMPRISGSSESGTSARFVTRPPTEAWPKCANVSGAPATVAAQELASEIEWAKARGIRMIITDNEENNPMLQLNIALGFKQSISWVMWQKAL